MAQCPVCGQPLPQGLDRQEIQARLEKVTAQARAQERRGLERDFQERWRDRLEGERKRIQREAERQVRKDLVDAQRRAEKAESKKATEIERVRRESEKRAERAARMAAQMAATQSQAEIEKLEGAREKDRARHEADRARLQTQLDLLSRKLDKQSAEQLGTEGEVDLLSQLRTAFSGDQIEPIRRGAKGADIIHESLREQQQKERDWHENAWQVEGKLYDKIDARRREIDVHVRTIFRPLAKPRIVPMRAGA